LGCPRDKFTKQEFDSLDKYLESGGNILILSGEGGEMKYLGFFLFIHRNNTNLNYFLEGYGININNDCVVRSSFFKYFHPKESYIQNGILFDEVTRISNGLPKENKKPNNTFL
jgi:intraflagellar transport protein 52